MNTLVFTVTALFLANLMCIHSDVVDERGNASLLQSHVVFKRGISVKSYIIDEAQMLQASSSIPISVEVLTDRKHPISTLNHSVPAGNHTIQWVLDDLASQGNFVTWKIVCTSIFVIISVDPNLPDPLDTKLSEEYKGSMTLNSWVNFVYEQDPITGISLASPDASRDASEIYCHIERGSTARSVFAAILEQTHGEWYFEIQKNNYHIDVPPPYTDAETKYLDSPAVGNQLGRTQVYYYPKQTM